MSGHVQTLFITPDRCPGDVLLAACAAFRPDFGTYGRFQAHVCGRVHI